MRKAAWVFCSLMVFMPQCALATSQPIYIVDNDVALADEVIIREGIRLAEDFAQSSMNITDLGSFFYEIRGADYDERFVGYTGNGTIITQVGNPVWIDTYPPLRRQQHPVHEYFHLVQEHLRGTPYESDPIWLVEGSAEYFGWQALISKGIVDETDIRAYHLSSLSFGQPTGTLEQYETISDFYSFGNAYSLGYLAVEILVEGEGITSLARFYENLASMDWRSAFTDAFGRTPADFYEQFEQQRWALGDFDPTDPFIGSLQTPAFPSDGQYEIALVASPDAVSAGGQGVIIGSTVAGAICNLNLGEIGDSDFTFYQASADTIGNVFWLFSVSETAPTDTATLAIDCGANSLPIEMDITA